MKNKFKKTEKEFESWANDILKRLQTILLLDSFTLQPIEKSGSKASESKLNYPYRDIQIRYSEDLFKDWENEKFNDAIQVLIHEMVHPLTDPLYCVSMDRFVSRDQIENEREGLTDYIANIVIRNIQI